MDVTREALADLLELQKADSVCDRLEARKRNLPEQVALDAASDELAAAESQAAEEQAIVDEVRGRQKRLDGEIESMRSKMEAEEQKLYAGAVSSPRELSALQEEVASLRRRMSTVEDSDLEVMEELEQAEKPLLSTTERIGEMTSRIEEMRVTRDAAALDVDSQLQSARQERDSWINKIDPELFEFYVQLRKAKGGVAAAALVDGSCQGCHMKLPAQELKRVKESTGLMRCDECGRILVVV